MKYEGKDVRVILHNIRSAHNVGSVFRTADAAGVSRVYLTGYTPAPLDRFGRVQPDIAKTALGAEQTIPWESHENTVRLIGHLKKEGVQAVAVEQHPKATDYKTFTPAHKTAFIFGNEVEGLSDEVCKATDSIIEIPMRGTKESLNVAVAAGIILFQY
jgi:tRNA G18 (ribose-2'-O)-methylase SpoU